MYDLREELLDAVERNIDTELDKGPFMDDKRLDDLYELRDRILETPYDYQLEDIDIESILN